MRAGGNSGIKKSTMKRYGGMGSAGNRMRASGSNFRIRSSRPSKTRLSTYNKSLHHNTQISQTKPGKSRHTLRSSQQPFIEMTESELLNPAGFSEVEHFQAKT